MDKKKMVLELIKSMTGTEKRYFRERFRSFTKDESPRYIELFDILCMPNDLASVKHGDAALYSYLYDALLLALRTFHAEKRVLYKFEGYLMESMLLFDRSLLGQALKRIEEAERLANDNKETLEILRAKDMHNVLKRHEFTRKYFNQIEQNHQEKKELLKILLVENEISLFYEKISYLMNGVKNKKVDEDEYKETLKEAFKKLKTYDNSPIFEAFTRYTQCKLQTILAFYYEEIEPASNKHVEYLRNIINVFEDAPSNFKAENFFNYIKAISNFINHCTRSGNHEEADKYVKEIERLETESLYNNVQQNVKLRYLQIRQQIYLSNSRFDLVIDQEESVKRFFEEGVKSEDKHIYMAMFYNIMLSYFLEAILNTNDLNKRRQLLEKARNTGLIINSDYNIEDASDQLRPMLLLGVIFLELDDVIRASNWFIRAANKCKNYKRNAINIISKCCNEPIVDRWVPLKRINQNHKIDEWMPELDLWIKTK